MYSAIKNEFLLICLQYVYISAIVFALKNAEDLFVPSQLVPIMKLARSKAPYTVQQMETDDFLNFKKFSQDIRILKVREDNQTKETINWTEVVEMRVQRSNPRDILFKTSHMQENYRSITLKRLVVCTFQQDIGKLNKQPPKISSEKFKDLMSLCEGITPIIRNLEL